MIVGREKKSVPSELFSASPSHREPLPTGQFQCKQTLRKCQEITSKKSRSLLEARSLLLVAGQGDGSAQKPPVVAVNPQAPEGRGRFQFLEKKTRSTSSSADNYTYRE